MRLPGCVFHPTDLSITMRECPGRELYNLQRGGILENVVLHIFIFVLVR